MDFEQISRCIKYYDTIDAKAKRLHDSHYDQPVLTDYAKKLIDRKEKNRKDAINKAMNLEVSS